MMCLFPTCMTITIWLQNRWANAEDWLRRRQTKLTNWWFDSRLVVWVNKKWPGWELGVVFAIVLATCALVGNLVFLIVATLQHKPGPAGLGTLREGACKQVDWDNKVAHGFINVISTLLTAQSNYCMQLLAAPTRHDVNVAHQKRQWVDIGMPSFRNIWRRNVSVPRILCWMMLAASSAPLHLLWNSMVIFSPRAYRYNQLAVSEGFVHGLPFDDSKLFTLKYSDEGETAQYPDNLHFVQQSLPTFEKLSSQDCKQKYAQLFIRDRGDVVVVFGQKELETNHSTIYGTAAGGYGAWPYKWLCPQEINQNFECYARLQKATGDWHFPDYDNPKVEYCLSKPMEQRCKLEYGFRITLLTVIANLLKLLCFIATYILLKRITKAVDNPNQDGKGDNILLITTGDAIASFLETPDPETLGISTVEKEDFENGIWDQRWVKPCPMPWKKRSSCAQFRAIGTKWWLIDMIMLSTIPLIPAIFLASRYRYLNKTLKLNKAAIKLLGLGNPSGLFLLNGQDPNNPDDYQQTSADILRHVVLANLPQLGLTIAYYFWNSHLTVMLAAVEYNKYSTRSDDPRASKKKKTKYGLRVSHPIKGTEQRATHFLTVPLKYWIWNFVLQTALHWLASQAIFFARVDLLDYWLEVSVKYSISQVGYSFLGMILVTAVAFVAWFLTLYVSLRRLDNWMPLAATCSGALSAACHPKDPNLRHHEKEVYWGVESNKGSVDAQKSTNEVTLTCTFTSLDATYPEADEFYA